MKACSWKNPTPEEDTLLELLVKLIEDFEEKSYQINASTPHSRLLHLMDARSLEAADLVKIMDTIEIVTQIINNQLEITKNKLRLWESFFMSIRVCFCSINPNRDLYYIIDCNLSRSPFIPLIMIQIRRRPPSTSVSVLYLSYEIAIPDSKPRHILEEIVWQKEVEVAQKRDRTPLAELHKKLPFAPKIRDFLAALKNGKTQTAIIAEVKKASPSKGVIREDFDPVAIAKSYQENGATCISVLTDEKFFQGSFDNLAKIRAAVDLPLLCKEFIIYPYQIYLARIHGADAVLLIAAILSDKD